VETARLTARRLVAVGVCAFAAHAVAYGSPWPADGVHAYLLWYGPVVIALSAVSGVLLPLTLALSVGAGRDTRLVRAATSLLPARPAERTIAAEAGRLMVGAMAFLLAQESLEQSLTLGHPAFARFAPGWWPLLIVALAVAALLVTLVERVTVSLAEVVRSGHTRVEGAVARQARPGLPAPPPRRTHPLAVHGALRAPPLLS
jgi:hypothetical protein